MRADQEIASIEVCAVRATWRATWLMIRIVSSAGICGLGECASAGGVEDISDLVAAIDTEVRGAAAAATRERIRALRGAPHPTPRVYEVVLHAIELALSDLLARADHSPLDLLPATRRRNQIALYANINRAERMRTSDRLARLGADAVRAGFTAVKLAPFDDADAQHGLEHLRALRAAIGPDVDLMVDVHQRLPFDEVVAILPLLEEIGVCWLEDAVGLTETERLQQLRTRTTIPLAGGEQARGVEDVGPALATGALSFVLPDVKIAGVAGAYEICMSALEAGVGASIHNPTGPVGTAASLLVAAALPTFHRLEFAFGEVPWRGSVVEPFEVVVGGTLAVPEGPGLGVTLAEPPFPAR